MGTEDSTPNVNAGTLPTAATPTLPFNTLGVPLPSQCSQVYGKEVLFDKRRRQNSLPMWQMEDVALIGPAGISC